jgi:hypothetical protein
VKGSRSTRVKNTQSADRAENGANPLNVGRRANAAFDDEGPEADKDDDRFIREAEKTGRFVSLKTFLRRFGR